MVMRQAGLLRLLLNAKVYAAMPVQKMGTGGVTFACINAAAPVADGVTVRDGDAYMCYGV